MTLRAAIYTRSSPAMSITAEDQARELGTIAAEKGCRIVAVHREAGTAGGKSGKRRPGLIALMNGITDGCYDVVIVKSLHLLGRDLGDLIGVLAAMKAAKVRLIASAEGVDTADDGGERGLLDVAGLFAGYLRFAKRERIAAGQQRARQAGVRFWPPSSAAQPAPEGSGGFGCWCRRPRGRQDRGDQPDERAPGSRPDARGRDAAG